MNQATIHATGAINGHPVSRGELLQGAPLVSAVGDQEHRDLVHDHPRKAHFEELDMVYARPLGEGRHLVFHNANGLLAEWESSAVHEDHIWFRVSPIGVLSPFWPDIEV